MILIFALSKFAAFKKWLCNFAFVHILAGTYIMCSLFVIKKAEKPELVSNKFLLIICAECVCFMFLYRSPHP